MNNGDCNNRLAAVAQSVERRIGSAEVTGPIPVSSFCASKTVVKKHRGIASKFHNCCCGSVGRASHW